MKKLFLFFTTITVLVMICLTGSNRVFAASEQAYTDYLFQFDQYRKRFGDYQVAFNQYQQFNSLTAQQDTLEKAKLFISQRDTVAKSYYLFLSEKLTENPGLLASERQLYRQIVTNEIAYLERHSVTVPQIASLSDAQKSSKDFISQYDAIQLGYRQTIVALQLGYLAYFARRFDESAQMAQQIINANRSSFTSDSAQSFDRWMLQISNKRTLYQEKANAVRTKAFTLKGKLTEQERVLTEIRTGLREAQQYLVEGVSYIKELENGMQYVTTL